MNTSDAGRRRPKLVRLVPALAASTLLAIITLRAGPAQATAVPPPPAGWSTVFTDTFTGTAGSPPSSANWFYDLGAGGWGNKEVENYTNSTTNSYQDGQGHLAIKATYSGGTWYSARLESVRDDFAAPRGGQLEMTASIMQPDPANPLGYWPAFWALGSPLRSGGTWPASGEIDMMEDVNGLNAASQTFHYGSGGSSGTPSMIACQGSSCETGYHTYSVIINRTKTRAEYLQFLIDGRVTDTIKEAQVGTKAWQQAIDHGFYILLNLAIGGSYPDYACNCTTPTSATTPGASMSVAYVAVYEKSLIPATWRS